MKNRRVLIERKTGALKRRLIRHMLFLVTISLIMLTILFLVVSRYQYKSNVRETLRNNNDMIIKVILDEDLYKNESKLAELLSKSKYRITLIAKDGRVIADSVIDKESTDNHINREEIKQAKAEDVGYANRYSSDTNENTMYVATSFKDGYIRSSMPIAEINALESGYYKYYFGIVLLVFMLSIVASLKLSHILLKPIHELGAIATEFARGEFSIRARNITKDEIGELSIIFNDMAEKLDNTLNEVVEKQNRLEAILRSMDSGVIAVDENFNVIMINPCAQRIFGVKSDIIGKSLVGYIKDFSVEKLFRQSEEDYKLIKIHYPRELDLRIRTTDIINDKNHMGTVAIVDDITDIKKLENMRSQFVANVSHELKTPLTSIKGFAETLKDVKDEKTREKFLDIINDESERLTRLINDILILSDIESNMDELLDEINVNACINEVCNLMKPMADSKNINLCCYHEGEQVIIGNRDRFKQMLINLVDNAIKYSDKDSNVFSSVFIGNKNEAENLIIWVKDEGIGIPKEKIGRLFERFYRLDKARSRDQGGTGLGLAIVKHIVMNLGGTIEVESELGKGSKFIVTIPYNKE